MCDEVGEEDLVPLDSDVALTSGISRKRPDAWKVHWGRRVLYILEFTESHAQKIVRMTSNQVEGSL